jgi:hypothetical protein
MASCTACSWQVDLEDTFCARCGAPVIDPLIGIVVGERYRIVSRLGVGGMGAVYRAEHTMMRRDLAIKVLLPALSARPNRQAAWATPTSFTSPTLAACPTARCSWPWSTWPAPR